MIPTASEDVEQLELLYIDDKNKKWHSHSAKQFDIYLAS